MNLIPDNDATVFTVSQLNREVRLILEQQFGFVWLEGEISNFSQPASGHWYFSLKDDKAQIRCAMFKNRNRSLGFKPKSGDQVLVRGALGLYEARGDFQLIVQQLQAVGDGLLQQRFEQSKRKLQAQGLFDDQNKQPIPPYPKKIAIITSATGAALKDVLHVLDRRYPVANIIIYPTAVQGALAKDQIIEAIKLADTRQECDIVLLVRGGGSLEDLWPFNEEQVAHAIYQCKLPIISGIGHEVDYTIADMVADLRAPTPSAAAELATPDIREERGVINALQNSLSTSVMEEIKNQNQIVRQLQERLIAQHPQRQLIQRAQRVDELDQRLGTSILHTVDKASSKLTLAYQNLKANSPQAFINTMSQRITQYQTDIQRAQSSNLDKLESRLTNLMRTLNGVSPLATLDRGYAVLKNNAQKTISSVNEVEPTDRVTATLADGELQCCVEKISK